MTDALPTKIPPALKRKDVQMIAGAALLGLAVGLYVGIKLARPVQWVPPVTASPAPCHDCDERAAALEDKLTDAEMVLVKQAIKERDERIAAEVADG